MVVLGCAGGLYLSNFQDIPRSWSRLEESWRRSSQILYHKLELSEVKEPRATLGDNWGTPVHPAGEQISHSDPAEAPEQHFNDIYILATRESTSYVSDGGGEWAGSRLWSLVTVMVLWIMIPMLS